MCAFLDRRAIAAALMTASFAGVASPGDAPADYSHVLPLSVDAGQAVVQLRVPRDVYLNARSPALDDLRVFDVAGMSMPFALADLAPPATVSRSASRLPSFPCTVARAMPWGYTIACRSGLGETAQSFR